MLDCSPASKPCKLQGLGEVYEEEFVKATVGTDVVEERDAATKAEARLLLKVGQPAAAVCSHFAGLARFPVRRHWSTQASDLCFQLGLQV